MIFMIFRHKLEKVRNHFFYLKLGAYGSVFKAIHKTTGIIRALKKLKKDYLVKEDE